LTFRSNDYSKNEGITSDWKALLLNKVVVGNGKKLTQDDITLTQPPSGYDSVSVLSWFSGWYTDKEPGSCRSSSRRGSELWWTCGLQQWCSPTIVSRHVWKPITSSQSVTFDTSSLRIQLWFPATYLVVSIKPTHCWQGISSVVVKFF